MGRNASMPGEGSVTDKLLGKFSAVNAARSKREADMTTDERRQHDADKLKKLAKRDGVDPRGYSQNRPGNVSHQADMTRDDRDDVIKQASKALLDCIEDKIGRGGIEVEHVSDGFKIVASETSKLDDAASHVKVARCVFSVKFETPKAGQYRKAFASVEYNDSKDKADMFKVSAVLRDADDTKRTIDFTAAALGEFINKGVARMSGNISRIASQSDSVKDNRYEDERKLVVKDFRKASAGYRQIPVNDVVRSAQLLKASGFSVLSRVLDASYTDDRGLQCPVYEVVCEATRLPEVDRILRTASEFKDIDRTPHNDEDKSGKQGTPFKNQEQQDDPTKFPGRTRTPTNMREPYEKSDAHDMAKDSEGKAFDGSEKPTTWQERALEKNSEGVPNKGEHTLKSDEQSLSERTPNMPTKDNPKQWQDRSLEVNKDSVLDAIGYGEMMKYERYVKQGQYALPLGSAGRGAYGPSGQVTPTGSTAPASTAPMSAPTSMSGVSGGAAASAPLAPTSQDVGQPSGQDIGFQVNEQGEGFYIIPKDMVEFLGDQPGAGPLAGAAEPTAPSTTPENKGLPGMPAAANKKEADKVPGPLGPMKVQETPEMSTEKREMDGMAHGKSTDESPRVTPSEEFKKNKVAVRVRYDNATSVMAAAQRLMVAANQIRTGKQLSRGEFAHCTRLASLMVNKIADGQYSISLSKLPKQDAFVQALLTRVAVPGGSGGAPNAKVPKSKGSEDSMDGLSHGKQSAGTEPTGFKTSETPEAKDDVIGGINKNPDEPNITKKQHGPEDGMSHGKSDGGKPLVKPSDEYKKQNPVAPMKSAKFKDFRDQLLANLSGGGEHKHPHRIFASVRQNIEADYAEARTEVMGKFSRFELNDVQVRNELEKLDQIKTARLRVMSSARTATLVKKQASKKEAAGGKPDTHAPLEYDDKKYHINTEDDWWNRAMEKSHGHPKDGLSDMGLKEDEGKASKGDLYDDPKNFVGRTSEPAGGVAKQQLHSVKADEGKAFDEDLHNDPKNWVGRSSEKSGWSAPDTYEYMMKTEQKKEAEKRIQDALALAPTAYRQPCITQKVFDRMCLHGGLTQKREAGKLAVSENLFSTARRYAYATTNLELIRHVVDLKARGLSDQDIELFAKARYAGETVNVPDIVASYEEAAADARFNFKREFKQNAELNKKISALLKKNAEVSDKTLNKVLELGGLDGEEKSVKDSAPALADSYWFGTKDPGVIEDVLKMADLGLARHEIEYFIAGKYGDKVYVNVDEILKARDAAGSKKKGQAEGGAEKKSKGVTASTEAKDGFDERSYDKEKNDEIATDMPEQRSWQKGDSAESDPERGRSDQPEDKVLDTDWQKPQPTVSSEEKSRSKTEQKAAGKKTPQQRVADLIRRKKASGKSAAANPFAVCHTTVDKESDPDKYERCVKDVKKKNVEEGSPEIPKSPSKKQSLGDENEMTGDSSKQGFELSDDTGDTGSEGPLGGDVVSKIMAYESGEMSDDEIVEFFQQLVDNGMINHLQGSYQRTARDLAEAGLIRISRGRKKAQINEDVLPKSSRDLGISQQHQTVTHHQVPGNNVSFAPNDTAYDNTGKFPAPQNLQSPYSVAHIVEAIVLDISRRNYVSAQEALDGVANGDRFKRLSKYQIKQVAETLRQYGFDVKAPAADKHEVVTK